jgi:hypothetical protein
MAIWSFDAFDASILYEILKNGDLDWWLLPNFPNGFHQRRSHSRIYEQNDDLHHILITLGS